MLPREILNALEEEVERRRDIICGGLDNFEEYRYHMGILEGFQESMEIVRTTYAQMQKED